MHAIDKMGVCVNGTKIIVLKYADDLVLLASSAVTSWIRSIRIILYREQANCQYWQK